MSKESFGFGLQEIQGIQGNLSESLDDSLESRILTSSSGGAIEGGSVDLPSMAFAANATYHKVGDDLVLRLGSESVVVEGYFVQTSPPLLTASDGGQITPQMVASFLETGTDQAYAHLFLEKLMGDDAPSVPKDTIAVVEGVGEEAVVIRNGKAITLQDGDALFKSDVISTGDDSELSILFADGTLFKIGGDARISLDDFSFNEHTSVGFQVLSILKGVFVYASGFVAKDDPSHVQLRTPVGEIGIRGTRVAGNVDADGAATAVTVLEGRVVVLTNQGEEYEMTQGFQTLQVSNDGERVEEIVISAQQAAEDYSDVFVDQGAVQDFIQQDTPVETLDAAEPAAQLPPVSVADARSILIQEFVSGAVSQGLEGEALVEFAVTLASITQSSLEDPNSAIERADISGDGFSSVRLTSSSGGDILTVITFADRQNAGGGAGDSSGGRAGGGTVGQDYFNFNSQTLVSGNSFVIETTSGKDGLIFSNFPTDVFFEFRRVSYNAQQNQAIDRNGRQVIEYDLKSDTQTSRQAATDTEGIDDDALLILVDWNGGQDSYFVLLRSYWNGYDDTDNDKDIESAYDAYTIQAPGTSLYNTPVDLDAVTIV